MIISKQTPNTVSHPLSSKFVCLWVFFVLVLFSIPSFAKTWHSLAPGVDYREINSNYLTPWSHIHAFRINLKNNQLSLITARDIARTYASVNEYAQFTKALIAINGGFFDSYSHPLGLRISNTLQKNPLKKISWWGIFYIKDKKPHLTDFKHFQANKQIEFAIQSGPRLLVNGRIPPLRPGRTERSALGITSQGDLIILVTDNAALSTTELAQLMKDPPLSCLYALNLDGGNSSQLHAQIGSFHLNVHGFSNVSDAIVVNSR